MIPLWLWKNFIGTINVDNSNPSDSGEINHENTNNQSFSTEYLSDNSGYRIFDDNSKVTDKRNISIQNKSDNDNLQDTQTSVTFNVSISLVIFI